MKKEDVTYLEKLNELYLSIKHPNLKNTCWILVEGKTDILLFRKLFNKNICKIESIPGGNSKLEEAISKLIKISDLLIGIRDADFIHLNNIEYKCQNVFLTDYHDIEMTMLSNKHIQDALFNEYIDNISTDQIISIIEPISLLKWLNDKEKLEIAFDKISFVELIIDENNPIDIDEYIKRVLSKSSVKIDKDLIKNKLKDLGKLRMNSYNICNGHDFLKTLASLIRKKGISKSISEVNLSSILRIAYREDDFAKTKLYSSIKDWADSKKIDIYTNAHN